MERLDEFLQDHAANERKVCGSALTLVAQYPRHRDLCVALIDLAREELDHFKQVHDLLVARGQPLGQDAPDPYMGALRRLLRKPDHTEYLLDRLLAFAIVEARGCERFRMLGEALPPGPLADFYAGLARAEARHHALFVRLARGHFDAEQVTTRLDALLDAEAAIVRRLPLRPSLH